MHVIQNVLCVSLPLSLHSPCLYVRWTDKRSIKAPPPPSSNQIKVVYRSWLHCI